MKSFRRTDLTFSLCGLNCLLCPMRMGGHCPGCGGGEGNQSCALARCSLERGGLDYCASCPDYPCPRYGGLDRYDSFITHQGRADSIRRFQEIGPAAYRRELEEKAALLQRLLLRCNAGRRKTFFTVAANLLGLEELRAAAEAADGLPAVQERERRAAEALEKAARDRGVELKLRRRPPGKKKNSEDT